ncbi:PREDICTED: protein regulator of cytokinesis 1-like [Nicrophorus vespilloides]|uniref:Protein regulator of cytokinesis 1-like n=1 Tax=Nicrophorus vespilloides TaxID=110193 RepID=A0ABM1NCR5_NICVS|nr:PREDICTED: protein regulator of cytokinesis 1-like [Nicrophorus vespilloides]
MAMDFLSSTLNSSYEDNDGVNERIEIWYNDLLSNIQNITYANMRKWIVIVSKLGLKDDKLNKCGQSIVKEFECFMEDLVKQAMESQNTLIDKITDLLKKSEILCKQLAMKMPEYGKTNMGLFDEELSLKVAVNKLEDQVQKRLQKVEALNEEYECTCKQLNIENCNKLNETPLPSLKEINEFNSLKLHSLKSLLNKRENQYKELRKNIIHTINELKIKSPLLEDEDLLLDHVNFIYSEENMLKVDNFLKTLNDKKQNIKIEIDALKLSIIKLWNMLGDAYVDTKLDLNNYSQYNYDTIEILQNEIKKCKQIKMDNLKIFINRLRKDLVDLWDKCKISENERSKFEYIQHTTLTEELLELHEIEIRKMQNYYEENSHIFELFNTWENLWTKMVDLEKKAKAPNRYRNRGGQLLREEKERNSLSKKIPKIEDSLLDLVAKYKTINKKEFLYMGYSIQCTIQNFKEKYENEKKMELSVKKQLRDLPGTPSKGISIDMGKLTPIKVSNLTVLKQHPGTPSPTKRKMQSPLTIIKKNRVNDIS